MVTIETNAPVIEPKKPKYVYEFKDKCPDCKQRLEFRSGQGWICNTDGCAVIAVKAGTVIRDAAPKAVKTTVQNPAYSHLVLEAPAVEEEKVRKPKRHWTIWTSAETEKILKMVKDNKTLLEIAAELPLRNRHSVEVRISAIRKQLGTKEIPYPQHKKYTRKDVWAVNEEEKLLGLLKSGKNFIEIAKEFPNRTHKALTVHTTKLRKRKGSQAVPYPPQQEIPIAMPKPAKSTHFSAHQRNMESLRTEIPEIPTAAETDLARWQRESLRTEIPEIPTAAETDLARWQRRQRMDPLGDLPQIDIDTAQTTDQKLADIIAAVTDARSNLTQATAKAERYIQAFQEATK